MSCRSWTFRTSSNFAVWRIGQAVSKKSLTLSMKHWIALIPPHRVVSPNHCLCPAAEVFERNASQSLDLMASGFPIRLLMTGGAQTR